MKKVTVQILATNSSGAHFNQYELHFEPEGTVNNLKSNVFEYFIFVLEGEIEVKVEKINRNEELSVGGYTYLPAGLDYILLNSSNKKSRVLYIEKIYKPFGSLSPKVIFNDEKKITAKPCDTYLEQNLIPYQEEISYDMAVNILNFKPGVSFGFVESHIMEHGLYMLTGSGIYWLNGDYHEVKANDYIYMAPYCPQYFYSTGLTIGRYLVYKDVNRDYNENL
jgi:(S)-ureidoglycine aminohydrolase